MSDFQDRVDTAVKWFGSLPYNVRQHVVKELIEHAIISEWMYCYTQEQAEQFAQEAECPVSLYEGLRYEHTGEPVADGCQKDTSHGQ